MSTALIQIHGWIFFALFLHGMLLAYLIRDRIAPALERDFYAGLWVLGFIFSVCVNIALGVLASLGGFGLDSIVWALIAIDLVLAVAIFTRITSQAVTRRTSGLLWLVAALCFVVMARNGGLVSLLADSWWHMSLVNEITEQQSLFVDRHHFSGTPRQSWNFVYEPGWHLNLALVLSFSGLPAPLLWHALGPWCVLITLLSYYLLALSLTENPRIAVLAVVLMALFLGGINAYFRVSPWPGNVAYALMYFALSLFFAIADRLNWPGGESSSWIRFNVFSSLLRAARDTRPLLVVFLVVLATMSMLHLAEVFWVVAALVCYSLALYLLTGSRSVGADRALRQDWYVLAGLWLWFFVLWAALSLWRQPQLATVLGTVAAALVVLVFAARLTGPPMGRRGVAARLSICAAMLYVFVDFEHLAALFEPLAPSSTGYYSAYIPREVWGYFSETLSVPKWEHQLRAGLLLNGILGVVLSVFLVLRQATRASVFLSATAVFSFLVIVSPYLFTFFTGLLPATGVYRFQILILHPIIIACVVGLAFEELHPSRCGRIETR